MNRLDEYVQEEISTLTANWRQCFFDKLQEKKEEKETAAADHLITDPRFRIPNADITAEILSRLPTKSIGRSMLVCKSWRDIITSPGFSSMHAKNNPSHTFIGINSPSSHAFEINMFEVSETRTSLAWKNFATSYTAKTNLRKGVLDGSHRRILVAGSCGGLLCLVERGFRLDVITVLNPITNECVKINPSSSDRGSNRRREAHYRFGYSPSTKEYKILRCSSSVVHEYDIFTVGVDKGWRKLPPHLFPAHVRHNNGPTLPSCNGAFHWLAGHSKHRYSFVLAFDIAGESTRRIPIPCTDQTGVRSEDPPCLYYCIDGRHVLQKTGDGGNTWSPIEVPNRAFVPRRVGDDDHYVVDFIACLDCAAKRCGGGALFWVRGCDAIGLYCSKSGKYNAVGFHDSSEELCEFTPNFSSMDRIVSGS